MAMVTCNGNVEKDVGDNFICCACGAEYMHQPAYDICTATIEDNKKEHVNKEGDHVSTGFGRE